LNLSVDGNPFEFRFQTYHGNSRDLQLLCGENRMILFAILVIKDFMSKAKDSSSRAKAIKIFQGQGQDFFQGQGHKIISWPTSSTSQNPHCDY